MKNKTLEGAWSGIKPSVAHFKVFGCVSHGHVLDSRRTNLDDKTETGENNREVGEI